MPKLKVGPMVRGVLGRVFSPTHVLHSMRLHAGRKKNRCAFDDAQLQLYAELLPRDFLHFGYFDDPTIAPDRISLGQVMDAQAQYADLLLDLVTDRNHPVLDVGCGMGGLSAMLAERGFTPMALTPDRYQIKHINNKFPAIKTFCTKFERFPADEHVAEFGTILNSESFQYLKLDLALPIIEKVLRPGGRWVMCDFFYNAPGVEKSLHVWSEFKARVESRGWRITLDRDITPHALPTLKFVHMWATRLGIPLMEFGRLKFRQKLPGVEYLVENALDEARAYALKQMETIDPDLFVRNNTYRMITLER